MGSFDDGTVFDSSREVGEPYEFLVGSTRVVPGFSEAVAGLGLGQSRRQTLTPADAYGASIRRRALMFSMRGLRLWHRHRRQFLLKAFADAARNRLACMMLSFYHE